MNIKRFIDLPNVSLGSGSHPSPEAGMCAMELVAWIAGEPHSDAPQCTCPVIAAYARQLNDQLRDDERQLMKSALVACIGTRGNREMEMSRMFMCADHAVRVFAPMALDARGKRDAAAKLRAIPEIVDKASALVGKNAAAAAAAYAYAAYAAAYAYAAYAYAAAYAAAADADAAAYACADADAAAYACGDAYAYAAREPIVQAGIDLLWKMIKLSWPDAAAVQEIPDSLKRELVTA